MLEVVTCTPSSSRSSGASRSVMTSHRPAFALATTANFTGALACDTRLPELRLPVSVPLATTPPAVARKLVIFAETDSLDDMALRVDELGLAIAAGAATRPRNDNPTTPDTTSLRIVFLPIDEMNLPLCSRPTRAGGS